MKQQLLLLLLCLLFLSFSLLLASMIEDVCKYVTDGKVQYDFCVATFQASPKSRTATDDYGLFVIGLELTLANHSYNLEFAKLMRDESSGLPPQAKKCIDVCIDVYMSSVLDLYDAIDSAKNKYPCPFEMARVHNATYTCQKAFEDAGQKDLLARENYYADTLDSIMSAFDVFLHPRR